MTSWQAPSSIRSDRPVRALTEFMDSRERLALLPTPLHRAPRLSRELGAEVWIKRDDLTGVGLGGNKVRKLELLAADARRCGADTLVSVGAPQSNHARTVAAVAAMVEMHCELVLAGARPEQPTGNLALDVFFGATLHFAGELDWAGLDAEARSTADRLRAQGWSPYTIPVGGSTALGTLAFAAAYLELAQQLGQAELPATAVVFASSSCGTQAGLELGRTLLGSGPRVIGVDVAKIARPLATTIAHLSGEAGALLGTAADGIEPVVLEGYLGDGYAVASAGSYAAMQQLARAEGILADPVYSAKALHALRNESWDGPVVFWHTGGVPALFSSEVGVGRWPT